MACSDFVADFITVIRNAQRAGKEKVTVPASKVTIRIAEILKEEGFVQQVKPFDEGNKKFVRIHLKYMQGVKPAIQGIRRISRPGCRTYSGYQDIPRVQGGLGVAIVSTSRGLLSDKNARQSKVGGELICSVW